MRKIDLTNFQVASSETARDINRRIALSLIRQRQPISRAELARQSGLQRSTVSAIIRQLIDEAWVREGASGNVLRGRRPRFLHLNVERAGILAVDIQPAATRVGLADLDARFVMRATWATPETPAAFAKALAQTVKEFRKATPEIVHEGMGVSLPGRIDQSGRLVFAPNLGWPSIDVRHLLASAVGLPVVVENAASACALAELWFGQHPDDVRHLVAVTVSDGVGVGLLLNGQLMHGHHSMAGEFGHVVLDETGPPCSCGQRGCWEQYASNSSALKHFLRASPSSSLTYRDLLHSAERHDARAIETIERQAHYLGIGLAALVMGLAPQIVVIVGEITAAWDRVGPIVADVMRRRSMASSGAPQIVPTDPATEPRLRGAVTLVVQQHFGAPNVA
jgi:predicted NBD/HSP70 family sugar kinase